MKLFPEDPAFVVGEVGFDDIDADGRPFDVLGRKALGQKLTDLVDRINQPLVIALDGGWGSGKSHFLKLWAGAHKKTGEEELNGKAEVIYFDAFEHDYLDDPLVSLVSRLTLDKADAPWQVGAISKLKRAALPLAKLGLRVGLGVATYGATEAAGALGDIAINKISDATDVQIDEFWKAETTRIKAMQGFRDALTALTGKGKSARKIVFIVDELDRCRPDYALSLLEIIKHFFAVPNVHFVLGVNLEALGHSVQSRYGREIDAVGYLQKFVQLKVRLPRYLDTYEKTQTTMAYLEKSLETSDLEQRYRDELMIQVAYLGRTHNLSLRDVNRILFECKLIGPSSKMAPNYFSVLISLLLMKVVGSKTYVRFMSAQATINDIETFWGTPNADVYFEPWLIEFWRATYGHNNPKMPYGQFLHDCGSQDRLRYVRRFFGRILDTFSPT